MFISFEINYTFRGKLQTVTFRSPFDFNKWVDKWVDNLTDNRVNIIKSIHNNRIIKFQKRT